MEASAQEVVAVGQPAAAAGAQAARPQLIRAMNEQLLLSQIRQLGVCSRADLARLSGLSKPTVSLALANVERAGLVRTAGQRTGVPGRSAVLYEIRPEAGYVLGLDIGHEYLRGAIADLTGEIRAKAESRSPSGIISKRVGELIRLADGICAAAGVARDQVTQTVLGSPGVYDPSRDAIALTGGLAGWDKRAVLAKLRAAFGPNFMVENDTDAAALAEREHGHGREFASFAFVSIGSGIGMGLVLGGQLHRGAHGVAGEIAFLPITEGVTGPAWMRFASAARWRPPVPRRRSSGRRDGPGCGPTRPGRCSPPRRPVTSAPSRSWPPRRGWSPRPSARS